jgi:ankyrin repeat protein
MAKLYYDRYPYIRDWANFQGKTALHAASMRGNEEIVRVRGPSRTVENFTPCKRYPGGSDHVHLTDRCYVTSVRTLT